MNSTASVISLLRDVRGVDHGGRAFEGGRLWGVTIQLAQVVVEVQHRVGYCHHEPVVEIILIVICYENGLVLCVLDLRDGDMALKWVLKAFVC